MKWDAACCRAKPRGDMARTVVQSNHRSWADFYLDVVATDGNAQMLSRMAVALVFPMFMGAVCIIRSVILFQRGRKHNKEVCLVITSPNCQPMSWLSLTVRVVREVSPLTPLIELQSFNSMIDRRMAASPVDGLIVYPEGMMACTQILLAAVVWQSHFAAACITSPAVLQGIGARDELHCQ